MSYRSHVRRNSVGKAGGRSPPGKQGGLGSARLPNEGDGRRVVTVNGFWGMVSSRGMVKMG